jgi:hypothetical protein
MSTSDLGQVRSSPSQCQQQTDGVAPGPMPQQNAFDGHGHEMHPQKFVRLIGCHESISASQQEAATRWH